MQSNSMQHNIAAYRGHIFTCSKATLCNAKRVLPKCSLVSTVLSSGIEHIRDGNLCVYKVYGIRMYTAFLECVVVLL